MRYRDRVDAGRRLAGLLADLGGAEPVVVGLPRGGVVVAAEVARALDAPLDVAVVRKVGAPRQPELAMGAVGEGGVAVVEGDVVRALGVDAAAWERVAARERELVERRAARYRAVRPAVPLGDRTVVVVDDGIATGSTARAAVQVVRAAGAARVVLAVPVAPAATLRAFEALADDVRAPLAPEDFGAVGRWYDEFGPVSDDEVDALLATAAAGG